MSRLVIGIVLAGLSLAASETFAGNPYLEPLKPTSFTAQAIVLPARMLGPTALRKENALAVEIQVQMEDFLPRNMEPTLLIDGVPVEGGKRVVTVEDRMTTIGFLVEQPQVLKEGATLSVRMGDEPSTQAEVPGVLRQKSIKPLSSDNMKQREMPSLSDWLQKKSK